MTEELATWERFAGAHPFIAGETLTLADCAFYSALAYQLHRGLSLDGFPNLQAYVARVGGRPAARRAVPLGWERPARRNLFQESRSL